MKRLFALKQVDGHLFQGIPSKNGPLCFESKQEAKARRDEINEAKLAGCPVCVTPGPDHHNWQE